MPLVSRKQSALYRRTVVDRSSRLFRERGFKDVSVNDVMNAVGLTHGGFYGNFQSKDALVAEACELAFAQGLETWKARIARNSDARAQRKDLVDGYLTVRSRDDPGAACPTAALVNDVAREPGDAPVRTSYVEGTEALLQILASTEGTGDPHLDRSAALADFATMMGAMLLSRATRGHRMSDDVLKAARDRLNSPASAAKRRAPRKRH